MGALGLVSVLISHVCDGELLAGLLIHPGEGSVDDSGLVVSASVLEDTLLFDAGAIAGLHVGAPLLGLNIGDLPHDLGGAGHGHGEEGDEDDEDIDGKLNEDDDEYDDDGDAEVEEGDATNDKKMWEEVDKDLGDLLAEVETRGHKEDEEDEEDESVLNIDIESEKNKAKDAKEEANGDTDEGAAKENAPVAKSPEKKHAAAAPTTPTAKTTAAASQPAKMATPKPTAKATKPGPASTKRNVLVSVKRTSAAAIKAATKSASNAAAADSK